MRQSVSSLSTIVALLVLYLGAPCLALAQSHAAMPMDETSASPCETAAGASDLCAAADPYAPPVAGPADAASPAIEPYPGASHDAPPVSPSATARSAAPPEAPPLFLLHRALLN